jgi:hypothetical protein
MIKRLDVLTESEGNKEYKIRKKRRGKERSRERKRKMREESPIIKIDAFCLQLSSRQTGQQFAIQNSN